MATLAEILERRQRRRRRDEPDEGFLPLGEIEERNISRMLWQPARALLEGMGWVDAQTRRLAMALTTGGPADVEGRAPTGEELVEQWIGRELPEGVPGEWEWRDVPGVATELALSPFNLLTIGLATKGGQLAGRGSELLRRARALRAIGGQAPERLKEARQLLPAIRQVSREARARGVPALLRPTWREQAQAGQRALLGLDIPFTGVRGPLIRAPGALAAIQAGGRAARRPFRRLAPFFRVGGRMAEGPAVTAGRRLLGKDYNALITAMEETARGGRRIGQEQRERILRTMAEWDVSRAEKSLTQLERTLKPFTEEAIEGAAAVRRLRRAIERAQGRGDIEAIERLTAKLTGVRRRVAERYRLLPGVAREPRAALLTVGLEQQTVPAKLERLSEKVQAEYAERIARWEAIRDAAVIAEDRVAAGRAQSAITSLRQNATDRAVQLAKRGELSRVFWHGLPEEIQAEARRIAVLTEDTLGLEQILGVPVSELSDSLLSYVHRALAPEGYRFSQVLTKLRIESPFARYGRQFTPAKGFVKRRIRAFEGRGVMSINEWANEFAEQLRREGFDIDFGKKGFAQFFLEDPSEIVMRRMIASGKARGSAELFGGIIERFNIPASLARRGDLSVAEFLEASKLRRLHGKPWRQALQESRYAEMVIPRELAHEALKIHRLIDTPDEIKALGQVFDSYNAMMRFWVTVPWTGYHIRNALSNVWMCWLAGMKNPGLFGRAAAMQWRAARALKRGLTDDKDLRLLQELADFGGMGGGMTGELSVLLQTAGPPGVAGRLGRIGRGILAPGQTRAGQVAMTGAAALENNAKVALYLDGLARGLSKREAADRVIKYLFDYSALGPADKVLRKWAFFYTFFRKNLPLQVESLFTQPAKMRAWLYGGGALGGPQAEMLPEYQRGRLPIIAGRTPIGERRFLRLGLPPEDLFTISGEGRPGISGAMRIGQKLWGMGAPLIRAIPELLTATSLSSGQPTTAGRIATGLTPASRFVSSGRLIGKVLEQRAAPEDLLRLVGVTTGRVSPRRARFRKALQALNAMLQEKAIRGQARPFRLYGQPAGRRDFELHRLLRLRRRLESLAGGRP